ncbi:MAG: hypothetical protein HY647_03550 [Acidobacteria bacterium]|nr:hypothetical protein [Acidobacteriota bacterium]
MESRNGGWIRRHPWRIGTARLALWGTILYGATALLAQGQPGTSETSSQAGATTPAIPTGPEVGQRIPYFRARDQFGRWQDFNSIRGPKGAVLSFNRSADW